MDEERPSATSTLPHPECPSQPTPHKANKEQKGVAPSKPSFFSQLHLNNSASLAAQLVKNREILCNAVDLGLIPGLGRFSGEGKWQSTPIFLPEKSHGQRYLVGYSPKGCKELDMKAVYCHPAYLTYMQSTS